MTGEIEILCYLGMVLVWLVVVTYLRSVEPRKK